MNQLKELNSEATVLASINYGGCGVVCSLSPHVG